jgi:hypothetical protein
LGTYDFEIEHRAGRIRNNADALSRRPCGGQECPHCDKHDNNPRGIRSESGGEPSQGSRDHKDLKVGVVEVTEEVGNTLDTGVGSPMEATSKDFTSQNEKVAKLAIKSESKSQILLNPDTNVYCPMEV